MGYLDTSALVAYYCPEALSAQVEAEMAREAELTISPLVDVELHSAVAQKVRTADLDISDAHRIVSRFRLHLSSGQYRVVPIGEREYELARDWLARFTTPLRALDALHLAATFANDLTVLTADQVLARCAKHFGVKCKLIS